MTTHDGLLSFLGAMPSRLAKAGAAAIRDLQAQLEAEQLKMQEVLVASANVIKAERKAREEAEAKCLRIESELRRACKQHEGAAEKWQAAESRADDFEKLYATSCANLYETQSRLAAANKGAERNAKVNQLLAKRVRGLQERLAAVFEETRERCAKKAKELAEEYTQDSEFAENIAKDINSLHRIESTAPDWRTMTVSELAAGNPSLKAYSDELESSKADLILQGMELCARLFDELSFGPYFHPSDKIRAEIARMKAPGRG